MIYIQRKDQYYLETVDQFETFREAKEALREYRISDPYTTYYTSQRACKDWNRRTLKRSLMS